MNSVYSIFRSPRLCFGASNRIYKGNSSLCLYSTSSSTSNVDAEEPVFLDDSVHVDLDRKRNKSRLTEVQRRKELGMPPELKENFISKRTYLRKVYGMYGKKSGVDPAVCWPDEQLLEERQEKERLLYPDSLEEMVKKDVDARREKDEAMEKRKKEVLQKMKEISEFTKKIEVKRKAREAEFQAQKEKREQMLEEVRQFFGYRIDIRDPRFKEMLERKEEEEKKKLKEKRKQEKQAKMLARLASMAEKSMQEMEASKKVSIPGEDKSEKPQT